MGLGPHDLDLLNWAALLHDIGKLEVDQDILTKPGRPSDVEWEQLRLHPLLGEELTAPLRGWLEHWQAAVGFHHERWDGKGYPRALRGEEIPIAGRIVAVADTYDVITSARSYKRAGSSVLGREEIAACAGAQFDPAVVRAFLNVSLGRMRMIMGPLSWLSHAPLLARLPLTPAIGTFAGTLGVIATAAASGAIAHPPAIPTTPARVVAAAPVAASSVHPHRIERHPSPPATVTVTAPHASPGRAPGRRRPPHIASVVAAAPVDCPGGSPGRPGSDPLRDDGNHHPAADRSATARRHDRFRRRPARPVGCGAHSPDASTHLYSAAGGRTPCGHDLDGDDLDGDDLDGDDDHVHSPQTGADDSGSAWPGPVPLAIP